ncbi:MAG: calcium/proton exchanger [Anaerolineales bacterium]|nr:MAG: calcium/proton exchanger [Anaerolineales bacterium]
MLENPLNALLPLAIIAIVMNALGASPVATLSVSAIAMIPMAGLIGEATEAIATTLGPRLSGFLNATFGNAAELIITLVAIREGLLELVKASITGSILGNLLLVLGLSMLTGGIRHGVQQFDREKASSDTLLLLLAVTALAIPSLFNQASLGIRDDLDVEILSLGVAGLMMVLYGLGIFYGLRLKTGPLTRPSAELVVHHKAWSVRTAILILFVSTGGVVWLSEILVHHIEAATVSLGLSQFFLGIIIVPIIGNVAEHMVAVRVALKDRLTLSVEIAVGSSLQIALFVVPVLVFVSLAIGNPLTLVYNPFELIALFGAVLIATLVAADGKANWLEGSVLISLYLMLALAFFLLR